MNLFIRKLVSRQFICHRYLTTERSRRAFRSPLLTEKGHSNNQRPFGYINEKNIILGIIAVNGAVFVTWKFSYANLRSNRDERLLEFMAKNFSIDF
jgi:hypothetical protein